MVTGAALARAKPPVNPSSPSKSTWAVDKDDVHVGRKQHHLQSSPKVPDSPIPEPLRHSPLHPLQSTMTGSACTELRPRRQNSCSAQ